MTAARHVARTHWLPIPRSHTGQVLTGPILAAASALVVGAWLVTRPSVAVVVVGLAIMAAANVVGVVIDDKRRKRAREVGK